MIGKYFKTILCGLLFSLLLAGCVNQPTAVSTPSLDVTVAASATPAPTAASATPASVAQPETPPLTVEVPPIAAGLQGLEIDAFFEESYKALLLRNPQYVTELALSAPFGVGNDRLNDMSDAYMRETQTLEVAILALLQTYDRAALTPEQQLSYDIYRWYLADVVRGHEFVYNDYLIRPGVIGYPGSLQHFLTQIHPVTNRQDAEDYITRLQQVQTQMAQVVDGLERREQAGVMLPRFMNRWIAGNIREMAQMSPTATPFYTSFAEKLAAVDSLSATDRQELLAAAETAIQDAVLPGYAALAACLEAQQKIATDDIGAARFPNGDEYYAYILRHYTSTDLSAAEIHEIGLQEVARIRAEMQTRFDALGYPANATVPALYNRVVQDSGVLYGADIQPAYEALIAAAERDAAAAFDLRPQAEVVVMGGPTGGYYVGPAIDGSRPGAFYAATTGADYPYKMPSLAYHESVPGHHYQIAIAQELDLPLFRTDVGFLGYIEGWALYAEWLAYDLGWYEGNLHGDLGRLQYDMFRAVRLVVDTGVHAQGWTYDQAVAYMVDNIGYPRNAVEGELWRYITWPGQATAYKIGMIKVMELRQRAETALGDRFDLKAFHNVVLGNGSVPLEILEQLVDAYIAQSM